MELVAAADRLGSWAAGVQARAVLALEHQLEVECVAVGPGQRRWAGEATTRGVPPRIVDIEVAARLGVSRRVGADRVRLAHALARVPATSAALRAGRIDARKAGIIAHAGLVVGLADAGRVEQVVLPDAPTQTYTALAQAVTAALMAVDPGAVAERARRVRADRYVHVGPSGDADGMAWLRALLPAEEAAAVDELLTAAALATRDLRGSPAAPRSSAPMAW